MKKILIILSFFFSLCYVGYSQSSKDVSIYRGDSTLIEFKVNGNITAKGIVFVVKLSKSFSSPRLIQKSNLIAGGSADEITATYSAPQTKVIVKLDPEDTQDLEATTYYYDIVAAEPTNLNVYYTFNYGKFIFTNGGDVQTPFDGTNLPGGGVRITTVSLPNGTLQNEYAKWDTTLNAWVPSGIVPGTGSGAVPDTFVTENELAAATNPKLDKTAFRDSLSKYAMETDPSQKILWNDGTRWIAITKSQFADSVGITSDDFFITGEWHFSNITVDTLTIVVQDTTTIRKFNTISKSTNYTLTNAYDVVLMTNTDVSDTITLPITGIENGRAFTIKKLDATAGATVVKVESGGTIDGETYYEIILQYESRQFIKSGSNYYIIF